LKQAEPLEKFSCHILPHLSLKVMPPTKLNIGVCGGGMGGLAAAISMAQAGADVTLLEAARELGEIGAGIQVLPNVSRFLIRWGADKIIGDDLIAVDEINTWGADNNLISCFDPKDGVKYTGFPHW
jgi:salicylate hydroxylase